MFNVFFSMPCNVLVFADLTVLKSVQFNVRRRILQDRHEDSIV